MRKNGEEREKKRGSRLNNLPREIFYIIIILAVPTTTCRAFTIPRPSVTRAALYPARNESPQISNDLISHVFFKLSSWFWQACDCILYLEIRLYNGKENV